MQLMYTAIGEYQSDGVPYLYNVQILIPVNFTHPGLVSQIFATANGEMNL